MDSNPGKPSFFNFTKNDSSFETKQPMNLSPKPTIKETGVFDATKFEANKTPLSSSTPFMKMNSPGSNSISPSVSPSTNKPLFSFLPSSTTNNLKSDKQSPNSKLLKFTSSLFTSNEKVVENNKKTNESVEDSEFSIKNESADTFFSKETSKEINSHKSFKTNLEQTLKDTQENKKKIQENVFFYEKKLDNTKKISEEKKILIDKQCKIKKSLQQEAEDLMIRNSALDKEICDLIIEEEKSRPVYDPIQIKKTNFCMIPASLREKAECLRKKLFLIKEKNQNVLLSLNSKFRGKYVYYNQKIESCKRNVLIKQTQFYSMAQYNAFQRLRFYSDAEADLRAVQDQIEDIENLSKTDKNIKKASLNTKAQYKVFLYKDCWFIILGLCLSVFLSLLTEFSFN